MGNPVFRAASLQDIPLIRDLAHRIWWAHYPGIISSEQIEYMLDWMYSEVELHEEISSGRARLWLVLLDDAAVGFFSLEAVPGQIRLSKIYLLAERHGQGLGQAMLAEAEAQATAQGFGSLRLTVNKGNSKALRAYERAGYVVIDEVVADIGQGFVMDDFVLEKVLAG